MAAGRLREGGWVGYTAIGQSPEKVRSRLKRYNVVAEQLEKDEKLAILSAYSATLGKKSLETYNEESLKVQDLSILFSQVVMKLQHEPESLRIIDNGSVLARYNDEKSFVDLLFHELYQSLPPLNQLQLSES